ncbi:hypothetical protein JZ751_011447 [Albula glossodonta]|uniref:Phostensin/Taperin PP1-binding domain-containing protein n=1 Tax=Albula glossodonta TaxID=121402 RepID=A0A8T2MYY9_9TELE|nr:hypothetical protein JZ751_011447 [Albula glossodonta]
MEADRPKHRAETGPGEKGPETRPGPEIRGGGRREGADSGAGLGVGGMQRQLEQLRLKEQDSRRRPNPLPGSKATATDERPAVFSKGKDEAQGERKGAQGPPHSQKNPQPTEARTRKTTALASNQAPQRQQPLSNQTQLRQHSQSNQAPPTRSFTVTPRSGSSAVSTVESTPKNAPSPSPPLFTLRSASGGSGKRGTTITITPRKTTPAAAAPAPATKMAPSAHTPTPNGTGEGGKKRYPTAEEIQVIGGYESLEKSCLVKHRGKHRGVKVCFDEVQLEQVCEYPSESSMLACFPCSTPLSSERERDEREEDDEEEEEEEKATFMSGGSKKAGPKAGRALKVDESCRR